MVFMDRELLQKTEMCPARCVFRKKEVHSMVYVLLYIYMVMS